MGHVNTKEINWQLEMKLTNLTLKEKSRTKALFDPRVELRVKLVDQEVAGARVRVLLPRRHLELGTHQSRSASKS